MMQEILKPLLDNEVLSEEVKTAIETSLTEAITAREEAVRAEVETEAMANFEAAKLKFEETFKKLEESYKIKLEEAKMIAESAKEEIDTLEDKISEMETKPFLNVTEEDLEAAEAKLVEELENKYEAAFELAKEKFENAFEIISESQADLIESLETKLTESENLVSELSKKIEDLDAKLTEAEENNDVAKAVFETEERMRSEATLAISKLKENLVTATEIFLEQEVSEMKKDYESIMKETQGRELLESIKGLVKQYWDIDAEVATEILEMKKETEAKVEQYKEMLKKEHSRLEESQKEIESLRKKVIVESKSSVLSSDKKEALEKLAESIDAEKLETSIDELMESVIDTFNSGFSKKDVQTKIVSQDKKEEMITESVGTSISSGDTEEKTSDELAKLLEFAGIK